MAKAIPKWVQERLSRLWKKYGGGEMTYPMITKVLSIDDKSTINVFLSELRNAGWIEVQPNKDDARKKIYLLKEPNKIMMEIIPNAN